MAEKKALVSFYSRTGNTRKAAEKIAEVLREKGFKPCLEEIKAVKSGHLRKKVKKLRKCESDWKKFDLVLVGTPTRGSAPSSAIKAYLKQCSNIEGKKVGLFVTCIAIPGKTIQKLEGMVSSRGGRVKASLVLKGLRGLSDKSLEAAKEFAESLC